MHSWPLKNMVFPQTLGKTLLKRWNLETLQSKIFFLLHAYICEKHLELVSNVFFVYVEKNKFNLRKKKTFSVFKGLKGAPLNTPKLYSQNVFNFHQIGPVGRFGLVIAMSVCLSLLLSLSNAIILKCWCQKGSNVECCYSVL